MANPKCPYDGYTMRFSKKTCNHFWCPKCGYTDGATPLQDPAVNRELKKFGWKLE